MGRLRPLLRLSVVLLLFLAVVGLDACDDDREPIVGPNTNLLSANDVFFIMQVSTFALIFQNFVADQALFLAEVSSDTMVTYVGETPQGTTTFQISGDGVGGDPDTATVTFTDFRATSLMPAADFITGQLQFVFDRTQDGLAYEVNPSDASLAPLGQAQFAVEYSLSAQAGSLVLLVSGPMTAEVVGDNVLQTGSFRLEDRSQGALIVLDLDITFGYDADQMPVFDIWPAGELEFGGFLGGATLQPFLVTLDGRGGATFQYEDRVCETDMALGENPCAGL